MTENTLKLPIEDRSLSHARWVHAVNKVFAEDGSYSIAMSTYCSACNHEIKEGTETSLCPQCGARMDAAWNKE